MVEAKDYMNPAIIGFLDSVLPTINCECGYNGLPIEMGQKQYSAWLREK